MLRRLAPEIQIREKGVSRAAQQKGINTSRYQMDKTADGWQKGFLGCASQRCTRPDVVLMMVAGWRKVMAGRRMRETCW